MKNRLLIAASLFFIVFIAGCATLRDANQRYFAKAHPIPFEADFNSVNLCKPGECAGLVCSRSTSTLCEVGKALGFGANDPDACKLPSLKEQKCEVVLIPDDATFDQLQNGRSVEVQLLSDRSGQTLNKYYPIQFMLGQGSSFNDFGNMNVYCKNRMKMAVKWLTGSSVVPYPLPEPSRAACFLDKEIMPVYVLYSDGKQVGTNPIGDGSRERRVGTALKDAGPAIVTTEIDYNIYSDPNYNYQNYEDAANAPIDPLIVDRIAQQAIALNDGCKDQNGISKCMVALAPRMGDRIALDEVLLKLKQYGREDAVDLVAFGINSRYSKYCDQRIFEQEALQFAKYIKEDKRAYGGLELSSKPIVIPYMLFETENAPSAGMLNQRPFACQWTSEIVWGQEQLDAINPGIYSSLFSYYLPSLMSAGVMGIAPYTFSGNEDPLSCPSCAMDSEVKRERWAGFCRSYVDVAGVQVTRSDGSTSSLPLGINPVLYSTGEVDCRFGKDNQRVFALQFNQGDLGLVKQPSFDSATDKMQQRYTCDSCVLSDTMRIDLLQSTPTVSASKQPLFCGTSTDDNEKLIDTAVKKYAERFDVDEALVRAVIWQESGFDPCAVSKVSTSVNDCNSLGADNQVPRTTQKPFIEYGAGAYPACTGTAPQPAGTDKKFCAYGLMQVIAYPGPIYDDPNYYTRISGNDALHYNLVKESGCLVSERDYNPFNVENSTCVGTYMLSGYIKDGYQFVMDSYNLFSSDDLLFDALSGSPREVNPSKINILATYVGLHDYYGDGGVVRNSIQAYADQKDIDVGSECNLVGNTYECSGGRRFEAGCAGERSFIKYVTQCVIKSTSCPGISEVRNAAQTNKFDYGACVLARYNGIVDKSSGCGNQMSCPGDYKLITGTAGGGP